MLRARWSRNQEGQLVATWTNDQEKTKSTHHWGVTEMTADVIPIGRLFRLATDTHFEFLRAS